jgi:hypothetical protein
MTIKVAEQDPLIDQILYFVHSGCLKIGKKLFCLKRKPCKHARTLAACAVVSRQWSNIAVRYLWGRYGTYDHLVKLALPKKSPRDDDEDDEDEDDEDEDDEDENVS